MYQKKGWYEVRNKKEGTFIDVEVSNDKDIICILSVV